MPFAGDGDAEPARALAYNTLFKLAGKSANTTRQAEVARALAREVNAEYSAATRGAICRFLSLVAGDESVKALAKAMHKPVFYAHEEVVAWLGS